MAELSTNPENGRRSGDVWSVACASSTAVSKGDMVCIESGAAAAASSTSVTATFLGIADESKDAGNASNIIVLSKGVFPLNKATGTAFSIGDGLQISDSNSVEAASSSAAKVAVCYKDAASSAAYVLAKIHSQL